MQTNLGYHVYQSHSVQHWIKCSALVLGIYALLAAMIWFISHIMPENSFLDQPPPAAPVLMEIAPLPSSTQLINPAVDEQKQPVIASSSPKTAHAEPEQKKVNVIAVTDQKHAEIQKNMSEKLMETKSLDISKDEKKKQVDLPKPMEEQQDTKQIQIQQASNNAVPLERKEEKIRAPEVGSVNTESNKVNDQQWENQVLAKLQKMKRYPAYAQHQKQQDVISIKIVLNHKGELINSTILQSQNFEVLDNEVRALVKRAQPYPVPPTTVLTANSVSLEVPIEFFLK